MFNVSGHIIIATSLRMDELQIRLYRPAFAALLFVSLDELVGQ
jgi:hypothetical protein